jgi:glutamyl/glutaminyl-tRNA synthetase
LINEKMKIKDIETVKKALNIALDILKNNWDFNSIDEIKNIFIEKIKEAEMKNGQVLWPVRVALSWEQFSIWALELIYILWTEKSRQRIENILKNL